MTKRKASIDWWNQGLGFVVAIIGILIAFQLDKCSSENGQRKTINVHLRQIKEEAEFNKQSLESCLKHGESNMAKLDTLLSLSMEGNDFERMNRLSLELLNLSRVYFRKNAYQNLIESGDIKLIKQFDTKQKIINLYEYYKWVEPYDEISRTLYSEDYHPYIQTNLDLLNSEIQEDEVYQSKLFRNILASYKRTGEERIQKYRDCIKEIEQYLNPK